MSKNKNHDAVTLECSRIYGYIKCIGFQPSRIHHSECASKYNLNCIENLKK